ncbi:MAG: RDD family protein [Actinomycetota bacterium]
MAASNDVAAYVHDGIITPEAVVLDVRTAGFASRILAALIDLVVVMVLLFVVSIFLVLVAFGDDSSSVTLFSIVLFGTLFVYPVAFETLWGGRTPGKAALGIRAVNVDGSPLRLKDATLRAMGGIVDRVLPPGGITGALFVTLTPRHQRVGDLIAGTIVVRDPERHAPTPAFWFSPPRGHEAFSESIDPTAITVAQYAVVRSFLTRANSMDPAIRASVARDLATRLAVIVHHPGSTGVAPETFLICAMARYQRRNGPGVARFSTPGAAAAPAAVRS